MFKKLVVEVAQLVDVVWDISTIIYDYVNRNNIKPVERLVKKNGLGWTLTHNAVIRGNKITDGVRTITILNDDSILIDRTGCVLSGNRVSMYLSIMRGEHGFFK